MVTEVRVVVMPVNFNDNLIVECPQDVKESCVVVILPKLGRFEVGACIDMVNDNNFALFFFRKSELGS